MKNYSFRQFLTEASHSRVMKILNGDIPTVYTVGIMSPENPNSEGLSKKENNKRVEYYKQYLKNKSFHSLVVHSSGASELRSYLGYTKTTGLYGQYENSFLIMNISRKDLIEMGSMFGQSAVIFGQKVNDGKQTHMRFEFIESDSKNKTPESYQTKSVREVAISSDIVVDDPVAGRIGKDVRDLEDNKTITKLKDKKGTPKQHRSFVIPFFNPVYAGAKPDKKNKTIEIHPNYDELDEFGLPKNKKDIAKAEGFFIPCFDHIAHGIDFQITNECLVTFDLSDVPNIKETHDLIALIDEKVKECIVEGALAPYYFTKRRNINESLESLKSLAKLKKDK